MAGIKIMLPVLASSFRTSKMRIIVPSLCRYHTVNSQKKCILLPHTRVVNHDSSDKQCLFIQSSNFCDNTVTDSTSHTTGANEAPEVLNQLLVRWNKTSGSEVVRYDEEQLTYIIGILLQTKIFTRDIVDCLGKSPHLVMKSKTAWEKAVMDLKKYFAPRQILHLIGSCPSLLEGKTKTMLQTIETLRSLHFIEGEIQQITVENPDILITTPSDLCKRVIKFQDIFPSDSCRKVIRKFPSLITEDWQTIQEKVDYALKDMGLEERRLVRTNFFAHSLSEIKSRHLFLSRAGLYRRPSKHGEPQTTNPLAKMIFNTGTKEFAHSVAQMPLHEFLAFRKLVKLEEKVLFEMNEDDYSDTDDESDSSDSESESDS